MDATKKNAAQSTTQETADLVQYIASLESRAQDADDNGRDAQASKLRAQARALAAQLVRQ